MANKYGPKIVTDGLVLCLDAAYKKSYPGTGTTWYDSSGNNNHGTLTNGPTFDGNNGGSIVFDGTNDYVQYGNVYSNVVYITLSAWFKSDINADGSRISRLISKEQSYLLQYDSTNDGYQSTIILHINGTYTQLPNSINLMANIWYNLTGTYDGSSLKLYTNGVLSNQISKTGSVSQNNNSLRIGSDISYSFDGKISVVKIYNRALSAVEIQQNYNATKGRFNL